MTVSAPGTLVLSLGKMVEDDDQAKVYPKGEDDYVILEEEDLDSEQLKARGR